MTTEAHPSTSFNPRRARPTFPVAYRIGVFIAALPVVAVALIDLITSVRFFPETNEAPIYSTIFESATVNAGEPYYLRAYALIAIGVCLAVHLVLMLIRKHQPSGGAVYVILGMAIAVTSAVSAWWCLSFNISSIAYSDAANVFSYAVKAAAGDWEPFEMCAGLPYNQMVQSATMYFTEYPFQAGLFWYYYFVCRLCGTDAYITLVTINVIANEVTFICACSISFKMLSANSARIVAVLLLGGFWPLYMLATFIYGNLLGFSFAMIFLAMQAAALNEVRAHGLTIKSVTIGVCSAIPLSIMQVIKLTYILFAITVAITWLVYAVYNRRKRHAGLIMSLVCVAVIGVSSSIGMLPKAMLERTTGINFGEGMPTISWIELGTSYADNNEAKAGWWDGTAYLIFKEANAYQETANKLYTEQVEENVNRMTSDPQYGWTFITRKLEAEWADPMFMSIYYTLLNKDYIVTPSYSEFASVANAHSPYKEILTTDVTIPLRAVFDTYQNIVVIGALAGACKLFERRNWVAILVLLVFFTGFGCYILWEAKSVYTLPFFYMLIPLCAFGLESREGTL